MSLNFRYTTEIQPYIISDALPTVNFPNMEDGQKLFDMVRQWSPEFPLMVMEFWPGWFDHWGQGHKGLSMPCKLRVFQLITNSTFLRNITSLPSFDVLILLTYSLSKNVLHNMEYCYKARILTKSSSCPGAH